MKEISRWKNIKGWEQRPFRQRWIHYYVLFPEYVRLLRDADYQCILDYGCGDGFLSYHLKNHLPTKDIVAYDVVENMRNMTRRNVEGIQVIEMLGQKQFDAICLNMVLQDVDEPLVLLTSLHKNLNSGGVLILTLPHPIYSLIEKNHMTTRRERLASNYAHDIFRYPFEETEKVYWSGDSENWTYLYNRMLQTYAELLYKSGFSTIAIREPLALEDGACESDLYDLYSKIPGFMFFVCAKRPLS